MDRSDENTLRGANRLDALPDELLRVINEYVVEPPDSCPFVTYKATKTTPSRQRRAHIEQWRDDCYVFLPRPLVERASDDDEYRYDYVFDLVRLSDNRVFTSPALRVGDDAVAVKANMRNLLAVQFDDGEVIDDPLGNFNPLNSTVSGTRSRFHRCRHMCFDFNSDMTQLVLVEERLEVNGNATDFVDHYYSRFGIWFAGTARVFEDELSFYMADNNTDSTNNRYAYWYEPRDEPAYEDDDPESGWKLQSEPHGDPPKGSLRVASFFFAHPTKFYVHTDYALCEDNETVRVLDLRVMHEIVRLKHEVQTLPRVSGAAASALASQALLAFENHWNDDVQDKVQTLLSQYGGARKACFVKNFRRLLRNSLPPSMTHLARRPPPRPIRTQFGLE